MAGKSNSDGQSISRYRPLRSTRNNLPPHFNDYITFEDEEICFVNFENFGNLDINHVRLNTVRVNQNNEHESQFSRDHRFTVAALGYVHNIHTVPNSLKEAMASPEWPQWREAILREIGELEEHKVGVLIDRTDIPVGTKVITGRYVFSKKYLENGEPVYKARYCARGCQQSWGLDYLDTYAPMSRMASIRVLMQLAAQYNLICHQIDVKTAYLNSEIDCELYMEQPETSERDNTKVWRLNKSIYGLKQSAKLWNETLNDFFEEIGFVRNRADLCLYKRHDERGIIFLLVWVDDVIILGETKVLVEEFVRAMNDKFTIKDLGQLTYFLGIEFEVRDQSVKMSQSGYCKSVIQRFGQESGYPSKLPCVKNVHDELRANLDSPKLDAAGTTRYRELVGSLIYLEQITRPDISFIVNILGQQMHQPNMAHWKMGLKVLRYLNGTSNFYLNYYPAENLELTIFGDADWANGVDRKSQNGYVAFLSDNSSPISWSSRKQSLVATSTTNAEYVAMSNATCEALWLQKLFWDIGYTNIKFMPTRLLCDNTGALCLAYTSTNSKRSKHIDVRYCVVNDYVKIGAVTLEHVISSHNLADGFTKSLGPNLFNQFFMNMSRESRRKHEIKTIHVVPPP